MKRQGRRSKEGGDPAPRIMQDLTKRFLKEVTKEATGQGKRGTEIRTGHHAGHDKERQGSLSGSRRSLRGGGTRFIAACGVLVREGALQHTRQRHRHRQLPPHVQHLRAEQACQLIDNFLSADQQTASGQKQPNRRCNTWAYASSNTMQAGLIRYFTVLGSTFATAQCWEALFTHPSMRWVCRTSNFQCLYSEPMHAP